MSDTPMPPLPRPNPWRVALGFLLAPVFAAGLFAVLADGPDFGLFLVSLFYGAIPATILIGIPAYFVLRNRVRPRLITLAAGGGVVAIVPWVIILMLSVGDHAEVGDCVAVVNGRTTWCGYLDNLKFLGMIFGLGVFGGIVFWSCVVWGDLRLSAPLGSVSNVER
jgi:hypothetical protein